MIQNVSGSGMRPAGLQADPFRAFEAEFGAGVSLPGLDGLEAAGGVSFGDLVAHALQETDAAKAKADALAFDFATGKPVDVHTLMIQVAKADTAMQLTSAVTSKVATGLNSLLQTQI